MCRFCYDNEEPKGNALCQCGHMWGEHIHIACPYCNLPDCWEERGPLASEEDFWKELYDQGEDKFES
jgi:hypothetical protein